jgi:tetratricopeptide (TPR) repeat protein
MKVVDFPKFKLIFVWTILVVLVGLLSATGLAQPKQVPGNAAETAFKQGVEAFEKNDYKTAFDKFTIAIKLDNRFSDAYYYRGRVCDEVPWIEQGANDDYSAAIKLNPNHADAFLHRAINASEKDHPLDDFAAALRIRPDFAEAYYQRAVARSKTALYWLPGIRSGRIKEEDLKYAQVGSPKKEEAVALLIGAIRSAVSDLKKATELSPQHVQAYSYLAKLYFELGEQDNAVSALTSAIAISPDNANAYYERGLAYLQLKDPKKANEDFSAVIRIRPDDSEAYNKRAVARMILQDFDGALQDYIEGLKRNPAYLVANRSSEPADLKVDLDKFDQMLPKLTKTTRERLADAYYQRALAVRYWNGDVQSLKMSVADLTKVLSLKSPHVSALYQRGLGLSGLGNHVEAIKDFSEVIRLQPQNGEAYYARGRSRRSLKDIQGAIDDFSRSIELAPEFAKAAYDRAGAYSELGDQQRAIADFTQAIARNPESLDAYYQRGLAQQSVDKYQKAIDDYRQVVRLANPNDKITSPPTMPLSANLAAIYYRGLARLSQAQLLGQRGHWVLKSEELAKKSLLESAATDFTQVISTRPGFANAYYQRGRARITTRIVTNARVGSASYNSDVEGALADFTKAIQLDPRYADPYFSRGAYFRDALKTQAAISDLTHAIKLDPGHAKAFYALGYLHSQNYETKRADPNAALNNYSLAIKANPNFVAAYFERADLFSEKAPTQAIADYTEIIRIDPNSAPAYRGRASIQKQLKQYSRALADYTRALDLDPSEPGSNDYVVAYTYVNRAYVRYSLGDGKGAQEDYRQALLIRPCLECVSGSSSVSQSSKAETFLQRGLALLRRGDKQGSRQNLEEAAKLFYTQGDMPKYESVKYQLSRF